jgi:hypothetical protein
LPSLAALEVSGPDQPGGHVQGGEQRGGSAGTNTLMAFMNFWASFSPPLILKDTIPPYPLHTLVASSC